MSYFIGNFGRASYLMTLTTVPLIEHLVAFDLNGTIDSWIKNHELMITVSSPQSGLHCCDRITGKATFSTGYGFKPEWSDTQDGWDPATSTLTQPLLFCIPPSG